MPMRRLFASLLIITGSAFAATITFTHTGIGSGTIGSTSFTNAVFTITDVGDTADRVCIADVCDIDDISAWISISGVGTFGFITPTRTFVNNTNAAVGFSRSSGSDLFDTWNPAFTTWDMLSAIGPITGDGWIGQWTGVVTTGGDLLFADAYPVPNTVFSASLGVPEPACFILIAFGLAAIGTLKTSARKPVV